MAVKTGERECVCSVLADASILFQLYLNPAAPISDSRSLLQVFRGRPLLLCPCDFHCKACLAMLSSFLHIVCPCHSFNLYHFWFLIGFCPQVTVADFVWLVYINNPV